MVYFYSKNSLENLSSCDERLQAVFKTVLEQIDTTIICGHRGEDDQNQAVVDGASKTAWPNSKHNHFPSQAVDACAYQKPLPWKNTGLAKHFAGIVLATAFMQGVTLRWGGDWDMDDDLDDQDFNDLWHFEIVEDE